MRCDDLQDKVVLVTGAASGIGRAVAERFGAQGARVAINHYRRPADAERTWQAVRDAGGDALVIDADVSRREQVDAMMDDIMRNLGVPDIVVNNAGVVLVKPFLETSVEQWQHLIDTDLTSVFHVCQAVLPHMLTSGDGCIINITSELAYLGRDRYSAYTAAKGGLVSLTRSLAREFAPTIRINAVAPGPTDTAMLASELTTPALREKEQAIPAGRFAAVAEIAASVVFLASQSAAFYYGETLSPNGGALMR